MPSLRSAALSDIGRVRRENEDRYICDASALLFGVADGVGGLPGGAEAAELAIREVSDAMRSRRDKEEFNLARAVQRARPDPLAWRMDARRNPHADGLRRDGLPLDHAQRAVRRLVDVVRH